ncbi:MAG TPA: riboflavin synthase [Candidatus Dormibacteraeota bacterium]|nr:riboflavin synthase [Candidatus Dormibacteraeota bacterium]
MFSGIVTALGEIEATPKEFQGELVIAHPPGWGDLDIGESVAVNGCCLTVVRREASRVALEVMPETVRRSNLGQLTLGDQVNLESAVALGAPIGGHLVSGHLDATGEVSVVQREENAVWVTVQVPREVARYCVPQGSIAIDGCSLTLVAVEDSVDGSAEVMVSLIPHTLKSTRAAGYLPGAVVNLEADSVAKLLERLLAPHLSSIAAGRPRTEPELQEGG